MPRLWQTHISLHLISSHIITYLFLWSQNIWKLSMIRPWPLNWWCLKSLSKASENRHLSRHWPDASPLGQSMAAPHFPWRVPRNGGRRCPACFQQDPEKMGSKRVGCFWQLDLLSLVGSLAQHGHGVASQVLGDFSWLVAMAFNMSSRWAKHLPERMNLMILLPGVPLGYPPIWPGWKMTWL